MLCSCSLTCRVVLTSEPPFPLRQHCFWKVYFVLACCWTIQNTLAGNMPQWVQKMKDQAFRLWLNYLDPLALGQHTIPSSTNLDRIITFISSCVNPLLDFVIATACLLLSCTHAWSLCFPSLTCMMQGLYLCRKFRFVSRRLQEVNFVKHVSIMVDTRGRESWEERWLSIAVKSEERSGDEYWEIIMDSIRSGGNTICSKREIRG